MVNSENPFEMFAREENEVENEKTKKQSKKYFWIKLKEGFFDDRFVKLIKAQPNGYRVLCVYLMLQLRSLKTDGILKYQNILPEFTDELATLINEPKEIVVEAIEILEKCGFLEVWDDYSVFLAIKNELVDYGNETDAAERMRKSRTKRNITPL